MSTSRLKSELLWHDCESCKLAETRTRVVLGFGNPKAKLMFVGEGPGADEDASGIPFVGPAGELHHDLVRAVGLKEDEIFQDNIVACRSFNTDDDGKRKDCPPKKPEIEACLPRLYEAIRSIDPILIVAYGATAFKALTKDNTIISKARGGVYQALVPGGDPELTGPNMIQYTVVPTYHPSYLRRRAGERRKPNSVWSECVKDLIRIVKMYDIAMERYYGVSSDRPEEVEL